MPRCRECKEKFEPRTFLQKYCRKNENCLTAESQFAREKVKQKNDKDWKVKKAEMKVNSHSKENKKHLQDEINKLSRLIDAKLGFNDCIDCQKPFNNHQIDACHFFSKGSNSTLALNLHNLHSGHNHCNFYNPQHESNYKKGLVLRYGKEYLEMLYEIPVEYDHIKLTNLERVEKLKIVRKIIRTFDTYVLTDGKQARTLFNKVIGIYN